MNFSKFRRFTGKINTFFVLDLETWVDGFLTSESLGKKYLELDHVASRRF